MNWISIHRATQIARFINMVEQSTWIVPTFGVLAVVLMVIVRLAV